MASRKTASHRRTASRGATASRGKPASRGGTASRRKSASRGARPYTGRVVVTLRMPSGDDIPLEWSNAGSGLSGVQRAAIEWTHVVRNRRRWTRSAESIQEQGDRARKFLASLGLDERQRGRLAKAGRVEVAIRYESETVGWEARIMPWEFLLAAATRDLRTGSLAVSRWLERKSFKTPGLVNPSVLYLEPVPARLAAEYVFVNERRLVQASTGTTAFTLLQNPTRDSLRRALHDVHPAILHLAGFDVHQGLKLLDDPRAERHVDGYLMCEEDNSPDPVTAEDLAQLLEKADHRPALVVCNIWNSAGRIAPLLVAAGAGAAIGFQDAFDDGLSELFVGAFYEALGPSGGDPKAAFDAAWGALLSQPKSIQGTGIALWQGGTRQASKQTATRPITRAPQNEAEQALDPKDVTTADATAAFAITTKPVKEISYALLHNDRDLFEQFLIRKLRPGRVNGLEVLVELHVGTETYPFRQSYEMKGLPPLDLSRKVRISLTSALARSVNELLRTSLFIEVKWGAHTLHRETVPVTLQPVDQWEDTDTNRLFLPSFVFPRDAAVASVIAKAQRYVTALRDDPFAGFDGYQSLDPEAEEPAYAVDAQVQAIWYALMHELPVDYINPPPTYATSGQRLRTPSDVIAGGRGTCIDLAILMASCLELVDIYPVVFLLVDHAFPGYWRSDEAHDDFIDRIARVGDGEANGNGARQGAAASARSEETWYFPKKLLPQIREEIKQGRLIPLETVGLTERDSFETAIDDSRKYFRVTADFDSMIDIVFARQCKVTPIPLHRG